MGRPRWLADRQACILPVARRPNSDYRMGLNSPSFKKFRSRLGVPPAPVVDRFRTGDAAVAADESVPAKTVLPRVASLLRL
jgi:hypothetical protein